MSTRFLLVFVCFLSLMSYVSSDIYLPAFPALQTAFATSKAFVEYTLTSYMLGLAFGQLIYGALSDVMGRKKLLIFGISLYVLASVGCAFSPTILILCMMRLLQAMGVCAAAALWQTVIVDNFEPGKSRDHIFSITIPVIALSPVFSPIMGGYLTAELGWHAVFLMSAFLGAILLYMTIFHYRDLRIIEGPKIIQGRILLRDCWQLMCSRAFQRYLGVIVFASAAFFIFITEIPFVFASLGETEERIGLMFLPQTLAFIGGGLFSHRVPTHRKERALYGLMILALLGSMILLIASILPPMSPWQYALPYAVTAFSNGATYPLAYGLVYEAHGESAGMVAGLGGFLLAFMGFIGSGLMGLLSVYGVLAMAVLIFLAYVLAFLVLRLPMAPYNIAKGTAQRS